MLSNFLKNLSILKKFLFINSIFFTIIGLFTFIYLKNVQPNLIKKKSKNINIINGGRYDNLIGDLGSNKKIPAVGAAINLND